LKMRMKSIVSLTIGALAVILCAALYVMMLGSPFFDCVNTPLYEVNSPDERVKVAVFERNCGATTPFTTQVSVLPSSSSLPNGVGNALVLDTDHGRAPSGPGGGPEVRVRWEASDHVVIQHHVKARLGKVKTQVGGVQIDYETFLRDGV
jgi:hypothetical protein